MTGLPNTSPVLRGVPRSNACLVSAANTARDGSSTIVSLFVAGTNFGSVIDLITIHAQVTTTAGMVRLFVYNGSVYFLFKEIPVDATTGTASVPEFSAEIARSDGLPVLVLPAGYTLFASTHNAESIALICQGWDF